MIASRWALIVAIVATTASAQTFQNFLDRVNSTPATARSAIIDSFMSAAGAFPFLEQDTLAHFIYRGSANSVAVPGDANGWEPNAFRMTNLASTNFWYNTEVFESDARLDYKFVLNGSNWILDPRNPNTVSGGFGPNSELRMPTYVPAPEIQFYPNLPHGTLRDTVFFSAALGNSRQIRVYKPPFYSSAGSRYPVVLFHDGLEYLTLANANNVLDYLFANYRIEPVVAVFVPPVNRTPEYAGSQQNKFTSFIVDELMPWVDGRFHTSQDPAKRAVIGASNGGNISLWIGFSHPEVFGNIGAQSSNVELNISNGYMNSPRRELQLYLDIGTYDLGVLIQRVNDFLPILASKGYTHQFLQFNEGHSWGNWRAHLKHPLEMFFPGAALAVSQRDELPEDFRLGQNFPNPFRVNTRITYRLDHTAAVSLVVFNIQGQIVRRLVNQVQPAGEHAILWDGMDQRLQPLANGMYFYRLSIAGRVIATKRMILLHD